MCVCTAQTLFLRTFNRGSPFLVGFPCLLRLFPPNTEWYKTGSIIRLAGQLSRDFYCCRRKYVVATMDRPNLVADKKKAVTAGIQANSSYWRRAGALRQGC